MTDRAVCLALHVVHFNQLVSGRVLVCRLPIEGKNVFARTNVFFWIAMTIQAPTHLQRVFPPHQRHFVDRPMTGLAGKPLFEMDAVIEVRKIGQIMNSRPTQRLAGAEAFADRLEHGTVGIELRMTVHTRLGRRDIGEVRIFDTGMTVAAIQANIAHVMFVAKRYGLLPNNAHFGVVRRTNVKGSQCDSPRHEKNCPENTHPGDRVHAGMKDLRHIPYFSLEN